MRDRPRGRRAGRVPGATLSVLPDDGHLTIMRTRAAEVLDGLAQHLPYSPIRLLMISFMISLVPPPMPRIRASR